MRETYSTHEIEFKDPYGNELLSLKVVVAVSPPEPDVGVFGNGEVAISVEEVYCFDEKYDPKENLVGDFAAEKLDDVAQQIYKEFY